MDSKLVRAGYLQVLNIPLGEYTTGIENENSISTIVLENGYFTNTIGFHLQEVIRMVFPEKLIEKQRCANS